MREGETRKVELLALCDDELAQGFRLAGIHARGLRETEVSEHLLRELQRRDYGLIIVDAGLLSEVDEGLRQRALASELPVVLFFPLGHAAVTSEELDEQLAELVRRMTGFDLLGGGV